MKVDVALQHVRRLFLDTAPVIYHVEGISAYQLLTDAIFQRISNGALEAITSPITLTECLVLPYRSGNTTLIQRFRQVITQGINTSYTRIDGVAEEAAKLRAKYKVSLPDAYQVAAAVASGCDALLSNDTALKQVTEILVLVLKDLEA